MEARHLREHPQEPRIGRAPRLRQDAAESAAAGVRQAARVAGDAHAHLGGPRANPQLAEQPQQVGVGALVVHDEPAVDPQRPPVCARTRRGCERARPDGPSASNSVTSWDRARTWAAVRPDTPAPTTAAVGRFIMLPDPELLSNVCPNSRLQCTRYVKGWRTPWRSSAPSPSTGPMRRGVRLPQRLHDHDRVGPGHRADHPRGRGRWGRHALSQRVEVHGPGDRADLRRHRARAAHAAGAARARTRRSSRTTRWR